MRDDGLGVEPRTEPDSERAVRTNVVTTWGKKYSSMLRALFDRAGLIEEC